MADNESSEDNGPAPLVEVKAEANLKGIGELSGVLNNLINAISRGIGRAYEPFERYLQVRADRAIVNEKAQTLIDLAKKRAELAEIEKQLADSQKLPSDNRAERAFSRLVDETFRKQANRENVAEAAILELSHSKIASDTEKKVDDDWLTKFWNIAENISQDEVRRFLAQLLAKEVSSPGTISPLTLRVLETITPGVAKRFEYFCRLSINDHDEAFVIHPNVFPFQNVGPLDMFGISYEDLYELESFGLIRSAETIMLNYATDANRNAADVDYAGSSAQLRYSGLQLHLLKFTRAGVELRNLLSLSEIPEYTNALKGKLGNAFTLGTF
jgi:hypothetical protein